MIPFLGYFFGNLFVSVISNFRLHPAFMLIPPFLGSLTGGWTILLMAMFSYIGDYTTDKTRAMNIAVIDGLMILVGNVAGLLGGFLFKLYGFQVPIYVQTSMHGLSFSTFWLSSVKENITQYFVEFQPFNWTVTFYTIYSCISGVCRSLAIIIGMVAFRKFLHINDHLIAFIGAFSGVLYFFGFGIAPDQLDAVHRRHSGDAAHDDDCLHAVHPVGVGGVLRARQDDEHDLESAGADAVDWRVHF
ncbi:hypothetical protein BV898_11471 [Hypsibius exemplaris]|uniref:Uncharacterized protein n=1 Tax=Hypsibius exemplaris TaxID=2072580 RepID=A0A1W0WGU8_HYPEX|nr:hypothetical protein BV898_11471 [Hypsibius exemplaris]